MSRNLQQMQQIHPQPTQAQQATYSKLKVEDALSYLDRVKQQFCAQPQVYNEFLDIMKEFKSQTIDTPGVISRVSTLFQGHKELIVGFNTFLPVGYKIELNKATNTINIYQPGSRAFDYMQGTMSAGMSLSSFESMHTKPQQRVHESFQVETPLLYNDHMSPVSMADNGTNQPVEFNHAIHYVNKIKNRYQQQPDVYKSFLEILHDYQKQQKFAKDLGQPIDNKAMEREVYRRVAVLFRDEPDLLQEFEQFLPDARASSPGAGSNSGYQPSNGSGLLTLCSSTMPKKFTSASASSAPSLQVSSLPTQSNSGCNPVVGSNGGTGGVGAAVHSSAGIGKRKRLSSTTSHLGPPSSRRLKPDSHSPTSKEVLAEISKYGSLGDFAFFDKVRSSLGESMYADFLRCLHLYGVKEMKMSPPDLMQMIHPFCLKMPELKKRMRQLLNQKDETSIDTSSSYAIDRICTGEFGGEIDYASCKRYDVSYLALPKDHVQPKCSGRTALCHEVLNDTYVSFPSWSEDSSSVIKKTTAEEMMFRCEEDRYQLDIILENMMSTTDLFRFLTAKMNVMTPEERSKYKLDNCLGGRSEFLHKKTIQGLYGEAASTVVEHLMSHPYETVPVVLKRLEAKVSEWKEAKARNSKIWNEQNQKYFLKSLDHAGINFKQSDSKHFRSKALLQEIENAYEKDRTPPHLTLTYQDRERFISDACGLIIHHVKRQANMHQEEKHKMKQLLKYFLPQFFFTSREPLSDDEGSSDDAKSFPTFQVQADSILRDVQYDTKLDSTSDSSVFFVNSNWYTFIRLHFLLCDRLKQFHSHAQRMIEEQMEESRSSSTSTAVSLGLRGPPPDPRQSYQQLLRMVRSYLDGHIEPASFEEQLREIFTTNAYVAFTVDKLIQNIVRQLQHLVTDDICIRLVDLYNTESPMSRMLSSSTSQPSWMIAELAYQRKAERLLVGENCFKLTFNKKQNVLGLELIPPNSSHANSPGSETWKGRVAMFVADDNNSDAAPSVDGSNRSSRRNKSFSTRSSVDAPVFIRKNLAKVASTRKVVADDERDALKEMYGLNALAGEFLDDVVLVDLKTLRRRYKSGSGSVFQIKRIDCLVVERIVRRSEEVRKLRRTRMEDWIGKISGVEYDLKTFARIEAV